MILACKAARAIDASKVITEKGMLGGPVDPLMPSQIFRCDESFAADGADLILGAVPASVVALRVSASCVYLDPAVREASNLLFFGL